MRPSLSPALTALALLALILATYLLLALEFPFAYIFATYEDLVGEWAQTWAFAVAAGLAARQAVKGHGYRPFFALLTMTLLYAFLEEISWGQRLFGIETPDFFQRHSLQQETNLHNLLTGPIDTPIKRAITAATVTALLAFGLIWPLLARLGPAPLRRLHERWLPAPPLHLAPWFVAAAALETGYLGFNELEIAELLVPLALCFMSWNHRVLDVPDAGTRSAASGSARLAHRQARGYGLITLLVGMLATATTAWVWNDPARRPALESRLYNGYEKFARRYARLGRWDHAATLYLRVHEREPDRAYILRRLADAHLHLGDRERFDHYNRMAIALGMAQLETDPTSVSTHLSLARSFRQRGDDATARYHVNRAHRIAKETVERTPDSAPAHYALARTYREMRDDAAALRHYRRASELDPESGRYRRAWLELEGVTEEAAEKEGEEGGVINTEEGGEGLQ